MTLTTRTLTVITTYRDRAAALCECLPSGADMFKRPYGTINNEGEPTIVGFISHGPIDIVYAAWLATRDAATISSVATEAGLQITESMVYDILDHSEISDEKPHEVMERLGYVLL